MQYEYAFLVLQLGDAQLYAHTLTLPERSPRMRLTVTVPDPVADEAKRLAEATGRSVSAIVARPSSATSPTSAAASPPNASARSSEPPRSAPTPMRCSVRSVRPPTASSPDGEAH